MDEIYREILPVSLAIASYCGIGLAIWENYISHKNLRDLVISNIKSRRKIISLEEVSSRDL